MSVPWVIVLADGEGRELQRSKPPSPEASHRVEHDVQVDAGSMLRHALDCASLLTTSDRVMTVIGHGQRSTVFDAMRVESAGTILEQPRDRGNAAAIYLGL